MLIARLIADQPDWETRIDALRRATFHQKALQFDWSTIFKSMESMAYSSATTLDFDVHVLELRWRFDEARLGLNIIEEHFGDCDVVVSQQEFAIPKLFVSDMDSTMIGQECIDELADYAGLKPQIAEITERAMQGELDFESALRERVRLLAGLDESAIEQCLQDRIRPTPGAKTLTRTLKAHGARTVLVTGGFHHFADRVADMLGFDRVVGNRLSVEAGKLSGGLDGSISDANTKLRVLQEEAANLGEGAAILASGDGANDVPMLQAATYGFAYRAKPKAREQASGRIDRGDLTSILSLLGIPKKDWVEA